MAQDGFNASLVRLMNQMGCYIDEQNKEIAELKKQIEELRVENNMRIIQMLSTIAYGDAVSNDTIAMEKL